MKVSDDFDAFKCELKIKKSSVKQAEWMKFDSNSDSLVQELFNVRKNTLNKNYQEKALKENFVSKDEIKSSDLPQKDDRNDTENNFAMMNQLTQSPKNKQERKPNSPNDENGKNMRKKNQEDHLYEIDLDKIGSCDKTTVIIMNIPQRYDLIMILEAIEKNHKGNYDFLYLPIDPRNKWNLGYAFINFSQPKYLKDFYNEFNGKKWEKLNSENMICKIKYARLQGQKALMQHFQYSNVMNQQEKKLRPYVPINNELPNKTKIYDLVRQQKDGKETSSM